jgi:hypothetical protein
MENDPSMHMDGIVPSLCELTPDFFEISRHASSGTCLLSPRLEGRDCLHKGAKGVFALETVAAGELLAVWGGEVITVRDLELLPFEIRRLSIQVEEDIYLLATREGPADWINHSCEPNAGLCGQAVLVAMRPILAGEEICFDYAMSDGSPYDEFDCRCGSLLCRGRITGNDWRRPELWERYRGFFSPYLQRRIDLLRGI